MPDYTTLIGAGEVAQAGRNIAGAAEDMKRAAAEITDTVNRQRADFDDFLIRLEAVLREDREARAQATEKRNG